MTPLHLGPDVVQRLIPHRRPFLMVDAVEALEVGERPALRASRLVTANEPVFEGHFPGLHLWPGVYTIEGLGQTCNLLLVLLAMQEDHGEPSEVLAALEHLERALTLRPHDARIVEVVSARLAARPRGWNLGMSAAVQVKLVRPVFAGQRLDYEVRRTHQHDALVRFDVEASVSGQRVAQGTMTSALSIGSLPGGGSDA